MDIRRAQNSEVVDFRMKLKSKPLTRRTRANLQWRILTEINPLL